MFSRRYVAAVSNKRLAEVRVTPRLGRPLRFEYKDSALLQLECVCVCVRGASCLNQFTPAELQTINTADDDDHVCQLDQLEK